MEKGEKIKSDTPPHGGSWIRNEETGELELVEAPTRAPGEPEPPAADVQNVPNVQDDQDVKTPETV